MNGPVGIAVNTRSLTATLSGVQRYVSEICRWLDGRFERVAPAAAMQGIRGHVWEQVWLPGIVKSRLLWSPANSGPVSVERQVVTVHDIAPLDHPEWFNRYFAVWYRWMIPALVRRSRRVIAVSEHTKRRLVQITGAAETKIVVIPNGVDKRFMRRPPEDIERVRQSLGIPSARYVLSLATLEPRKNIAGQLQAWSRCVGSLPADIWLVIAGNNGARRVFSGIQIEHPPPRVHFTGFVPDDRLPALYSGAIALLYPSIYEGFGLPVVEAMATGTTVIVSDSTSLPEVVGDAGVRVDPRDAGAIADAIHRVVVDEDFRNALSQLALRRSRLFSWERASELTWRVLQEASDYPVQRRLHDSRVGSYS